MGMWMAAHRTSGLMETQDFDKICFSSFIKNKILPVCGLKNYNLLRNVS